MRMYTTNITMNQISYINLTKVYILFITLLLYSGYSKFQVVKKMLIHLLGGNAIDLYPSYPDKRQWIPISCHVRSCITQLVITNLIFLPYSKKNCEHIYCEYIRNYIYIYIYIYIYRFINIGIYTVNITYTYICLERTNDLGACSQPKPRSPVLGRPSIYVQGGPKMGVFP